MIDRKELKKKFEDIKRGNVKGLELMDLVENSKEFSNECPSYKNNDKHIFIDLDFKCEGCDECDIRGGSELSIKKAKDCIDRGLNPNYIGLGGSWYKEGTDIKKLVKKVIEAVVFIEGYDTIKSGYLLSSFGYDFELHPYIYSLYLKELCEEGFLDDIGEEFSDEIEDGFYKLKSKKLDRDQYEIENVKIEADVGFDCRECGSFLERNLEFNGKEFNSKMGMIECDYCGEVNYLEIDKWL